MRLVHPQLPSPFRRPFPAVDITFSGERPAADVTFFNGSYSGYLRFCQMLMTKFKNDRRTPGYAKEIETKLLKTKRSGPRPLFVRNDTSDERRRSVRRSEHNTPQTEKPAAHSTGAKSDPWPDRAGDHAPDRRRRHERPFAERRKAPRLGHTAHRAGGTAAESRPHLSTARHDLERLRGCVLGSFRVEGSPPRLDRSEGP